MAEVPTIASPDGGGPPGHDKLNPIVVPRPSLSGTREVYYPQSTPPNWALLGFYPLFHPLKEGSVGAIPFR